MRVSHNDDDDKGISNQLSRYFRFGLRGAIQHQESTTCGYYADILEHGRWANYQRQGEQGVILLPLVDGEKCTSIIAFLNLTTPFVLTKML